jgi:oligopeptide transport system permease protein
LAALNGCVGDVSSITDDYMDAAIPIIGADGSLLNIIYILDNRSTVSDLNNQLFLIIMQALLVGMPIGMLLGIISAVWRGSRFDYACQIGSVISTSIPAFVLAAVMQLIFGVHLKWFPVSQWLSFKHTILPTIILSLGIIAGHCRNMRTLMLEVGRQDYLKTAKSKGIGNIRIVVFHQIRNAILPMITGLGLEIAGLLMGSYIIEKVFSIPGLGNYFVTSITGLDYTMTLGLVVFQATIVVFANFIVDLLYGIIDPRVRVV